MIPFPAIPTPQGSMNHTGPEVRLHPSSPGTLEKWAHHVASTAIRRWKGPPVRWPLSQSKIRSVLKCPKSAVTHVRPGVCHAVPMCISAAHTPAVSAVSVLCMAPGCSRVAATSPRLPVPCQLSWWLLPRAGHAEPRVLLTTRNRSSARGARAPLPPNQQQALSLISAALEGPRSP